MGLYYRYNDKPEKVCYSIAELGERMDFFRWNQSMNLRAEKPGRGVHDEDVQNPDKAGTEDGSSL